MLQFLRDSRIVVKEHGSADTVLDRDDPLAILDVLRSGVELEPGLTAGGLLRCLSPWSPLLSKLGWLNMHAWTSTASTAHLRDANGIDMTDPERLDGLVLRPSVQFIDRRGGPMELTVDWSVSGRYATPFTPAGSNRSERYCSISLSPLETWINLPVAVDAVVEPVPPVGVPMTVSPSFYDTIILGFLDDISAFGDPEETISIRAELLQAIQDIEQGV